MKNSTKNLAAFLAGATAGALVGILFAPGKGSNTREKLTHFLKDLGDFIKDKAGAEIGRLCELKDQVIKDMKSKVNNNNVADKQYDGVEHA